MPKAIYVVGIAVIWLAASGAVIWWALFVREIYESGWSLLAWPVVSLPTLVVAFILHRVWHWCWVWSNTRKAMDRRLSLERCSGSKKLADDEMIHQQWRSQLKSEDR